MFRPTGARKGKRGFTLTRACSFEANQVVGSMYGDHRCPFWLVLFEKGPGLPGGSIIYQGHLFSTKDTHDGDLYVIQQLVALNKYPPFVLLISPGSGVPE